METVRVWVDLTERGVWTERVDERTTRLWGGEKGLALPVLLDRLRGDTDPLGADTGTMRVLRGGFYTSPPMYVRSAKRWQDVPNADYSDVEGFRTALTVP